MSLKLEKPVIFFDLETTGIDISKDRIVEIAIFKVFPNGNKESKTWLVNPTIPIPAETTAVHGITDEKVANEPTFNELATTVYNMIKDSDLAGFNSDRFDIPLLADKFVREICEDYGIPKKTITPKALEELKATRWPGNIRELRNVMERLVILSEQKITEAIENLIKDKITFVIAHRLSTIKKADKIALLRHGKLCAIGSDEELLKTSQEYLKLKRLQH